MIELTKDYIENLKSIIEAKDDANDFFLPYIY